MGSKRCRREEGRDWQRRDGEMGSHWESHSWLGSCEGSREVRARRSLPTELRDIQGVDIGYKDQSLLPTGCPSHQ